VCGKTTIAPLLDTLTSRTTWRRPRNSSAAVEEIDVQRASARSLIERVEVRGIIPPSRKYAELTSPV
jgi:hypothetical protein